MARCRKLDPSSRSQTDAVIVLFLSLAAILGLPARSAAQPKSDDPQRLAEALRLYDAKQWSEAANVANGPPDQSPELDYLAGMSLAHLQRWDEAREAFSAGHRKAPKDIRFLTERAGAEYRLHDFKQAKRDLAEALRLDSGNAYAKDFLGTIYLLEGNLEAALKYWNLLGKPRLASVTIEPQPSVRKELLERAITFSAPAILERDQYLETNARLENLQIFTSWRTELTNADETDYAAGMRLAEQTGWGSSWLSGALGLLRGLPYETVYPSYFNLARGAANLTSMVRWDSEKRRFSGDFSFPLFDKPARRASFFFDARNENWNLSTTFAASAAPLTDLNVRRFAGGVKLHAVQSGRWGWTSGFEMVSRNFRNVPVLTSASAAPFFTSSKSFETWLELQRSLVRAPEHRFTVDGTGELRFGRGFADGLGPFGSFTASLKAHWLPKPQGDDYETIVHLRAGDIVGSVPLDQLFQLGVERDNDLWLRGQRSTINGRKGRAPLGRKYVLLNTEISKTVYDSGFFRVQCGPFMDTGDVADASGLFGSHQWLWDAGAQMKIRVLGSVSVVLTYGWDLRSGTGTFYGTTAR